MRYARECANKWLLKEIEIITKDGAKLIIALGNDVKKWVEKQKIEEKFKINIVQLPHPSGRSRKWNNKNNKEIIYEIKNLLNNITELV